VERTEQLALFAVCVMENCDIHQFAVSLYSYCSCLTAYLTFYMHISCKLGWHVRISVDNISSHLIRLCITVCIISNCVQHFCCLCSKSHHLPPDNPESLLIKQSANNPPCFLPEKALQRNSQVRNKFKSPPSVCASTVVVSLLTTITPENTEEDLLDPEPARLISRAAQM
jgi:hypothetical protein